MGLGEFAGKVVMRYTADTSQARAELKNLSAEEKKLAEARIKAQEADNKATKKSAENWQFAAASIGVATAAVAFGKSAVEAYGRSSVEAGSRVKELGDHFESAFEKTMAGIGEAVMAFAPLLDAIATAGEHLADLGSIGAKVAKGLSWVTGVGVGVSAASWYMHRNDDADAAAQAHYTQDHFDTGYADTKRLLGKAADVAIARWGQLSKDAQVQIDFATDGFEMDAMDMKQVRAELKAAAKARLDALKAAWKPVTDQLSVVGKTPFLDTEDRAYARYQAELEQRGINDDKADNAAGFAQGSASSGFNFGTERYAAGGSANQSAAIDAMMGGVRDKEAALEKLNSGQSLMEKTFGPVDQIQAYQAALTGTFSAFTDGFGAAYEAAVTGSEGIGKAFKKAAAASLMATGKEAAVNAIKEGAYALGSLAIYDFKGAATHGLAAAEWGVVAVAAGVASSALGGSGGSSHSSGGSGASAPSAPSSSGGSSSGQQQTIIVYGDNFTNESPRARERMAQQIVESATGNSTWRNN